MKFDPTIDAKTAARQSSGPRTTKVEQRANGAQENAARKEPPANAAPPIADDNPATSAAETGESFNQPKLQAESLHAPSVLLEVPIDTDVCVQGFASCNIDFNATPRQAAAAKLLWCSLSHQGQRFQGGRSSHPEGTTVENVNDGIRWFLDRLADAIEADCGAALTNDFGFVFR